MDMHTLRIGTLNCEYLLSNIVGIKKPSDSLLKGNGGSRWMVSYRNMKSQSDFDKFGRYIP